MYSQTGGQGAGETRKMGPLSSPCAPLTSEEINAPGGKLNMHRVTI
jgi:hypothetical protein